MAFSATHGIYRPAEIRRIRREQAAIAQAIARFEPVVMFANRYDIAEARALCGSPVTVPQLAHYDVWTRDTLPSVVFDTQNRRHAVSWNFNVWGDKFAGYEADRTFARRFARHLELPLVSANIVTEGGAIEVDGEGTLLTTESCLLNPNRNPGRSRNEIERELTRLTGAGNIIWLPGSKADAVTDGHIDGIARFVKPGVIVTEITDDRRDPEYRDLQRAAEILDSATDAKGRKFEVIRLKRPRFDVMPTRGEDFAASYVNCYLANDGIVLPQFGDAARDRAAMGLFSELLPEYEIVT